MLSGRCCFPTSGRRRVRRRRDHLHEWRTAFQLDLQGFRGALVLGRLNCVLSGVEERILSKGDSWNALGPQPESRTIKAGAASVLKFPVLVGFCFLQSLRSSVFKHVAFAATGVLWPLLLIQSARRESLDLRSGRRVGRRFLGKRSDCR